MGKIIAIGGGEIKDKETFPIDREIVSLTEKEQPRALFLPTASGDAEGYIDTFHCIYGEELRCETTVLRLASGNPEEDEIRSKIEKADLIYVGGGNTQKMMRIWGENGVDKLLWEAHDNGTVLSGLSAGAMCWFEAGHSDSESFDAQGDEWEYIRVDCLDIIEDIIFCPHYHFEDRVEPFLDFMEEYPDKGGLAIDNNCAIKIVDDSFEIISSEEGSHAYRVFVDADGIVEREISEGERQNLSILHP